ncbi:hypothetical protein [Gracilimonas sp.]|uniref:hypothetical protein n=1 Tax=Gracilimonas sp. TaxID=1974203 RepID=UPI002872A165|nr:hypothetical protein [Gracilimonas sp.]
MFDFIKNLFQRKRNGKPESSFPDLDISSLISRIKRKESESDISPGYAICTFDHGIFTIRLDRDITNNHRITVWQ